VVVLRGLVSAAELNGKRAAAGSFDPVKGQLLVILETGGGKELRVKPANVEIVEAPVGLEVAVVGLVGELQHNGKRGVIVGGPDSVGGRFKVRVAGAAKPLGLKPGNLWPVLFGPREAQAQQPSSDSLAATAVGEEGADTDARATTLLRAPPAACPADPGLQTQQLVEAGWQMGPPPQSVATLAARFGVAFPEVASIGWQLAEAGNRGEWLPAIPQPAAGSDDEIQEIQEAPDGAVAELASAKAEDECSDAALGAEDAAEASVDPGIAEPVSAAGDQPTAFDRAAAMMQLLLQDTELGPHFASQPETLRAFENSVLHFFEEHSSESEGVFIEDTVGGAVPWAARARDALGLHDDVRARASGAHSHPSPVRSGRARHGHS
jgi:hypothetical protein